MQNRRQKPFQTKYNLLIAINLTSAQAFNLYIGQQFLQLKKVEELLRDEFPLNDGVSCIINNIKYSAVMKSARITVFLRQITGAA